MCLSYSYLRQIPANYWCHIFSQRNSTRLAFNLMDWVEFIVPSVHCISWNQTAELLFIDHLKKSQFLKSNSQYKKVMPFLPVQHNLSNTMNSHDGRLDRSSVKYQVGGSGTLNFRPLMKGNSYSLIGPTLMQAFSLMSQ